MTETYEFPRWMRVLGFVLALLMWFGCLFFAYQVHTSPHSAASKAVLGAMAVLSAAFGTWMFRNTRRLADRITVSETEIVRTSPSGYTARLNWSEIEETRDSTALQYLELRAHRRKSRIRIEYGIANAGVLFNYIAARTEHLVDKAKLPFAFEPQKQLLLLGFWFLPTAALAGAALVRWNGSGSYELLLGAVAWSCLGLAFWLFGVQRILVEADGVTIIRRASSRSVAFSETRGIAFSVGGATTRYLSLSLVLMNRREADLSYAGVDKIFLYHLLRRALRTRRTEDSA